MGSPECHWCSSSEDVLLLRYRRHDSWPPRRVDSGTSWSARPKSLMETHSLILLSKRSQISMLLPHRESEAFTFILLICAKKNRSFFLPSLWGLTYVQLLRYFYYEKRAECVGLCVCLCVCVWKAHIHALYACFFYCSIAWPLYLRLMHFTLFFWIGWFD